MRFRLRHRLLHRLHDQRRRRTIRVADSEADHVDARRPLGGDLALELRERVRRDAFQALARFHRAPSSGMSRPRAALTFYWHRTGKQVRVEGKVERVARAEADRHWKAYRRDTQLATAALDAAIEATRRTEFVSAFAALRRRWRGKDIPRPPRWIGFRVVPDAVEFWQQRPRRLNDREVFFRTRGKWKRRWMPP